MKSRHLPLAVVALLAAAPAQEPPPALGMEFFAGRRELLMKKVLAAAAELGDVHPVVFLRGADPDGSMGQFYQDHDFYYLSGVVEPSVSMLLFPESGRQVLFVPPFSRFTATWEGDRLVPGAEAAQSTGFDEVANARELERGLDQLLADAGGRPTVVWTFTTPQPNRTSTPASAAGAATRVSRDPLDGRPSREERLAAVLTEQHHVQVRDVTDLIGAMRAVKTAEEVGAIRRASEIAAAGIAEAMRGTRPGVYEFQIAAVARYVFSRLGAGPDAYAAIVGAGPNGCVLHYSALTKRAEDGELVVMDYAPTVRGYCADVTRTFPANGRFTPEQRKLVEDVWEIQQALIAEVRPGARLSQLGRRCSELLAERGYRSVHGPSHHVGLAVHDKEGDVLEPGMVITVEPGAYLTREGMGCRIEDVVLVTADGAEVLSAGVPSRPDRIEALMAEPGLLEAPVPALPPTGDPAAGR